MEFIIANSWLIALIVISGGALLIPALRRSGAKASLLQATQLMNQRCTVVDVRDATDFAAGHIKNAKNIPLSELAKRITELEKQKAHPVLTVCTSGVRSATASAVLTRAGFANVLSLDGGMSAWQNQGLPVVK